jgi:hypothetical protein
MCILEWREPNGISRCSVAYALAYSAKSVLMSASKINRPTIPADRGPTLTFDKNGKKHISLPSFKTRERFPSFIPITNLA